MTKYIIIVLIFLATPVCYSQEILPTSSKPELTEINLDLNLPNKEYNLKKPDLQNEKKIKNYEDDDMPYDIITSPIQLLKQYGFNENKY